MENFQRIKVVGKGSYGEVWLSKHNKDKKQYVLKKMDLKKASKRERKAAEQEAKLLSKLKHPNIVGYKDSFENDGYLWIAMSFCEGGDLYNNLKGRKGVLLDERQIVEWFVQISMALQYLHERNILHRDLKTQNIFLTRSKIIKLGDLGIARVLDNSTDMATTLIGTPYYMSPELFSNKPYNHKSDVWALGCCVYEMATLKHAFNAKDMNSLVYKILRGKMPPMPVQYSQELTTLIRAMLDQNPARRPSVNKILRDPFIKRNIAIFLEGTRKNRRTGGARGQSSSARTDRVDGASASSNRNGSAGKGRDRPSSGDAKKKSKSLYTPIPVEKPRPLPHIPSPVASEGSNPKLQSPATPTDARSSSSALENDGDEMEEGQRTNPNMSARARRRERSMREETPRNSYDGIQHIHLEPRRKGSAGSERPDSAKSDGGYRNANRRSAGGRMVGSENAIQEQRARPRRQASLADEDDDESSSVDNEEERAEQREEKEAEQLERMLDATLHIAVDVDDDTLEMEGASPSDPAAPSAVKSDPQIGEAPMFSKETLNSSGRLMERIVALRKDCLNSVGLEKLHKSFQILDDIDSENMEARLKELLGQPLFDEYAGKIWQLKFCEESAFKIN